MVLNRIAAGWQAAAAPLLLYVTATPTSVGWIGEPVQRVLAVAYVACALAALVRPTDGWAQSFVATTGVPFWGLRALTFLSIVLTEHRRSAWAGVILYSTIALFVGLFYQRTIFRIGFHREYERQLTGGSHAAE